MYLIPSNISKKFEFFPGFGWKELFILLAFGALGGLITFLISLITDHFLRFLPVVFLSGIGYLLTKPIEGENNGLNMLFYIRDFIKSQKVFLYEKRGINNEV